MKRTGHRHGPRPPPLPRASALPPLTLDRPSSAIVLLGLVAAEATSRCASEEARIRAELDSRIDFEREYFGEGATERWAERSRLWTPVACTVDCAPIDPAGYVAAPTVTLLAERGPSDRMSVTLSVCRLRQLRVAMANWPVSAPKPFAGKEPVSVAEAVDWARRLVGRALDVLLAFSDPLRD